MGHLNGMAIAGVVLLCILLLVTVDNVNALVVVGHLLAVENDGLVQARGHWGHELLDAFAANLRHFYISTHR